MIKTTYAWFWIRHLALSIDMVFFLFLATITIIIIWFLFSALWFSEEIYWEIISNIIWFIVSVSYFSLMHYYYGQTLWKMAMWVKVVNVKLKNISIYQAFWRYFATIVSSLPLLLWFFWAWWDNKKRSFHDLLAKTLVITVRKTPSWVVIIWNILVLIVWIITISLMIQAMMILLQDPDFINTIQTTEWVN